MSTLDIFYATVVIAFVVGLLSMFFSYADYTTIGYIQNATNVLPNIAGPSTLLSDSKQFSLFFPDLTALMVMILITESWILSFYLSSHPVAAVLGIFALFAYMIISYYVSNEAVAIARESVFAPIISASNPLLFIFINMPTILAFAAVIDIAIAFTAIRRG